MTPMVLSTNTHKKWMLGNNVKLKLWIIYVRHNESLCSNKMLTASEFVIPRIKYNCRYCHFTNVMLEQKLAVLLYLMFLIYIPNII